MRIVADTNTVVSGIYWRGSPRQLIDLARDQKVALVTSLGLLAELDDVMAREKFAIRVNKAALSAKALVGAYAELALVLEPGELKQPVARDPDDDKVIACAVAAKADAIVSGDNDLLSLGSYQSIPILTARQALDMIETEA